VGPLDFGGDTGALWILSISEESLGGTQPPCGGGSKEAFFVEDVGERYLL